MNSERIVLGPDIGVVVHAYELTAGTVRGPAWSLVTNGLTTFGQREVVLTILRTSATPRQFPKTVLEYVGALKHFALLGKIVGDGDLSGYRAPGPFQLGSFVGLGFFDATPISGIDLPEGALAGVFLTEGELSMATGSSVYRVLNALGRTARYFPVPFWSDPGRASVYQAGDLTRSILANLPRARVPSASATLHGDVMYLTVPSTFAAVLSERIERREVLAILPGRAPGVAAALVWHPGQQEPEAIFDETAEPSAIAATFVAFAPSDTDKDEIRLIEDGYAVLLSVRSANELVASLKSGSTLEIGSRSVGRTLMVATIAVQ
jgi:hypothetical protein